MSKLATTVNGLTLPNPFVIGSGPPGTNANVIGKAFDEGWGAVIAKTVSLDATQVVNVQPRYARLRSRTSNEIYGWENIELISDRPFDVWIDEFKQLKDKYPDRILIASVMEEFSQDAWCEIIERCQDTGVDAFELNLSCPHGLPERRMGSAMGEDPEIAREVCGRRNIFARRHRCVGRKLKPVTCDGCAACPCLNLCQTCTSRRNVPNGRYGRTGCRHDWCRRVCDHKRRRAFPDHRRIYGQVADREVDRRTARIHHIVACRMRDVEVCSRHTSADEVCTVDGIWIGRSGSIRDSNFAGSANLLCGDSNCSMVWW